MVVCGTQHNLTWAQQKLHRTAVGPFTVKVGTLEIYHEIVVVCVKSGIMPLALDT